MFLHVQLCQSPLHPRTEFLRTLRRLLRVQPGIRLACGFLFPELSGTIVPVLDLCGQTFLDRLDGLVDPCRSALPYLFQMGWDERAHGIAACQPLDITREPVLPRKEGTNGLGFLGLRRTIVEIGCVARIRCTAVRAYLDEVDVL